MAFHLPLNGTYHSRTQGFCRDGRTLSLDTLASPVASLFSFLLLNSGESTEIEMTEARGDYTHCITNTMSLLTSTKKTHSDTKKKIKREKTYVTSPADSGFSSPKNMSRQRYIKRNIKHIRHCQVLYKKAKQLPCFKTHLVLGAAPIF